MRILLCNFVFLISSLLFCQGYTQKVNVFLGTSGDHGQLSPAASSPFSMLSIGPQTYPSIHIGYEYKAKKFLGFTHTRMEGVGCRGNGGNILLTPILNNDSLLIKKYEKAGPGYYEVEFKNGMSVKTTTKNNFGLYNFHFPAKGKIKLDISHSFVDGFVSSDYNISNNVIEGFVVNKTTCGAGQYKIYFAFKFPKESKIHESKNNEIIINLNEENFDVGVGLSSVGEKYALNKIEDLNYEDLKIKSEDHWNKLLNRVKVNGAIEDENLFYSLLYRGLQSPFNITENDGTYKAIDGNIYKTSRPIYNGFAIWDNYREQIPLLSIFLPKIYADISHSIANLYHFEKKQWPTMNEVSPTVRNEHALVVMLDAINKGINLPIDVIKNEIINEINSISANTPDKLLEFSYDLWAASELLKPINTGASNKFIDEALKYKTTWKNDFEDITTEDADKMQARGLYQGTIWQYRWFVPHDLSGLIDLIGDENKFIDQLDLFFNGDYYNHANQPDLHVPRMYNATSMPWKSQRLFRKLLKEDVIQFYFNNNSRGVDPYIGRIYKNEPEAFLRTMDDDAGTMSSWWVMRSLGLSPVNVGEPYFYITSPIFNSYKILFTNGRSFDVEVENQHPDNHYIKRLFFNNKELNRNWLSYNEIIAGGELKIILDYKPNKSLFQNNLYKTSIKPRLN